MPALPWISVRPVDPGTECIVMASRLPLRSYLRVPAFLVWTLRIRRQLATTPGLVGYALDARLFHKTFWTVSAWTGRAELGAFNRTDPHRTATDTIRRGMLPSTFVVWTVRAAELPIQWDEVRARIGKPSQR